MWLNWLYPFLCANCIAINTLHVKWVLLSNAYFFTFYYISQVLYQRGTLKHIIIVNNPLKWKCVIQIADAHNYTNGTWQSSSMKECKSDEKPVELPICHCKAETPLLKSSCLNIDTQTNVSVVDVFKQTAINLERLF